MYLECSLGVKNKFNSRNKEEIGEDLKNMKRPAQTLEQSDKGKTLSQIIESATF